MKTERTADRIVVRDNPFGFWLFYGTFVIGGCLVVLMMFSESVQGIQLVFGMLIGVGNILGGLLMLKREPASFVTVDRSRNEVRVRRWGPLGKSVKHFSLGQIVGARVETSEHVDGGTVFRPSLVLKEGRDAVPVSRFWYQSDEASRRVTDEINAFLSGASAAQQGAAPDEPRR
jgi:hypothetical protein